MNLPQIFFLHLLLPVFVAIFCSFFNRFKFSFLLLVAACLFCIISSGIVAYYTFCNDFSILYALGGWSTKYGIEIKADFLNSVFVCILWVVFLSSVIYSLCTTSEKFKKASLFWPIMLICCFGMIGMIYTNDIFNLYVFLEIASLSSYTIVASRRSKMSYIAAFEYLIVGTFAGTLYLLGIGFLYSVTGTLNIEELIRKIPSVIALKTTKIGIIFVLVAFLIKSAIFPLYSWLVKIYQSCCCTVGAFLSGTSTKVSVYLFAKFFCIVFFNNQGLISPKLSQIISLIGAFTALFASALAAFQCKEIRKILSYSSISHIGYMLVTLCAESNTAMKILLLQIVAHSTAKPCIFIALGHMEEGAHPTKQVSSLIMPYILLSCVSIIG